MAKKKTASKLIGFARLRVTDPDKLRQIAAKAGRTAQKRHGKRIRWTKSEARRQAPRGGRAVQREYRKEGHPLQIAQARREALSRKIREGLKKRKQKPVEEPVEVMAGDLPVQEEGPILGPEPEPEKEVANG